MTKYADHPRVLDLELNPDPGEWGHRHDFFCDDCGNTFNDTDLDGRNQCPFCYSEDYWPNDSQQIFKATKRRKIPKQKRPHLEIAA